MNTLPRDVLLEIYAYIPASWPMMCKVCRSWRNTLMDTPMRDKSAQYCLNLAAADGSHKMSLRMGLITCADILTYVDAEYWDLLMRADYQWYYTGVSRTWLSDFCERCDVENLNDAHRIIHDRYSTSPCDCAFTWACFMETLMCRVLSKCLTRDDDQLAAAIVYADNIGVLTHAHEIGIKFDERAFHGASFRMLRTLHKLGYKWGHDVIAGLFSGNGLIFSTDECKDIIKYICGNGYVISVNDYKTAINSKAYGLMIFIIAQPRLNYM